MVLVCCEEPPHCLVELSCEVVERLQRFLALLSLFVCIHKIIDSIAHIGSHACSSAVEQRKIDSQASGDESEKCGTHTERHCAVTAQIGRPPEFPAWLAGPRFPICPHRRFPPVEQPVIARAERDEGVEASIEIFQGGGIRLIVLEQAVEKLFLLP